MLLTWAITEFDDEGAGEVDEDLRLVGFDAVDACHSEPTVVCQGFKPGPMGTAVWVRRVA